MPTSRQAAVIRWIARAKIGDGPRGSQGVVAGRALGIGGFREGQVLLEQHLDADALL